MRSDLMVARRAVDGLGLRIAVCTGGSKRFVVCVGQLGRRAAAAVDRRAHHRLVLHRIEGAGGVDQGPAGAQQAQTAQEQRELQEQRQQVQQQLGS